MPECETKMFIRISSKLRTKHWFPELMKKSSIADMQNFPSPFVRRKSAKALCFPNFAPTGIFGPKGGTSFERLTATLKIIYR